MTAADVSMAAGTGTDRLRVGGLHAENVVVGAVPANGQAANQAAATEACWPRWTAR